MKRTHSNKVDFKVGARAKSRHTTTAKVKRKDKIRRKSSKKKIDLIQVEDAYDFNDSRSDDSEGSATTVNTGCKRYLFVLVVKFSTSVIHSRHDHNEHACSVLHGDFPKRATIH